MRVRFLPALVLALMMAGAFAPVATAAESDNANTKVMSG